MTLGRVVILLALAASLVAGAFHYANRAGYNEAVAKQQKKEKLEVIDEANKWANRPRNLHDAGMRLLDRAKLKQSETDLFGRP